MEKFAEGISPHENLTVTKTNNNLTPSGVSYKIDKPTIKDNNGSCGGIL